MPGPGPSSSYCRGSRRLLQAAGIAALGLLALPSVTAHAQDNSTSPVSIPAGAVPPRPAASSSVPDKPVSARQALEADDAYLEGAKQMEHDDFAAAERSFARAVELDPARQEYILSLAFAREHHLTQLVQDAAKARLLGDNARADSLLAQARTLDPHNRIVTQHLGVDAAPLPTVIPPEDLRDHGPAFGGPVEFEPTPGKKDIHLRGGAQDVVRELYSAFGITVTFDSSVTDSVPMKLDLDNVDFKSAARVAEDMTHTFAVAVQPKSALVAKDTAENRERLAPQIEETIYLPGLSSEAMTEMANLARNVFNIKQVTASPTGGDIVVRGDEDTLRLLNATYDDMLDGGSDVQLDLHLYEVDKTHTQDIGASMPSSISGFPLIATAENLINANQSLIDEAISGGLLVLTNDSNANTISELYLLIEAGVSGSSQFTSLLGVLGNFAGLPLAGISLGSGSTINMLLNSSDVRMLDDIQLRAGNHEATEFRAGTRYPITTATYSSGVSSSLTSSLAGLSVNGTPVSSLLAQYGLSGAGAAATVPQIQYEDLGITVKATPRIERSGGVSVALDMKIEALGSGSIDGIPVLNNRSFTSTFSIPAGKTAMLASSVSRNETRDIEGVPGLNEIPGFQGTDKDDEIDSSELILTITPHIVRAGRVRITSRRLAMARIPSGESQ